MQYLNCTILVNCHLISDKNDATKSSCILRVKSIFLERNPSRIDFQILRGQASLFFSNGKLGFQIQVRLSWSRATLNVCICAFSCIGILQKSMYQRYQKGTPILLSCGPSWGSTETMITRTFTWNTREMYFCLCVSLAYSQSSLVTS